MVKWKDFKLSRLLGWIAIILRKQPMPVGKIFIFCMAFINVLNVFKCNPLLSGPAVQVRTARLFSFARQI